MMDRDKKDKLPVMQVNFIDQICMPVYKVSVGITKKTESIVLWDIRIFKSTQVILWVV